MSMKRKHVERYCTCTPVLVRASIEVHSEKGEIDLHKQLSFVWDETHSVDAAR